jgi:NADH-quinone oxidoreductase subunit G
MLKISTAIIDNMEIPVEGEKNLLELIRKANIELPTFCYHSEISVYGACRMCIVEVKGRGFVPACSTEVTDGMVVSTNTREIRDMRRMIVELMLANHDCNCTTCPKNGDCRLQKIARQMGISEIRFKKVNKPQPLDRSSDSILRDPNKCVLCGDCVRVCKEIQTIGVLDFAYRGANAKVTPCFDKGIGEVECVNCGQCIKVCPVGALTPKYQISEVWDKIYDVNKHVVVQLAPAVRVALGEYFGFKPGTLTTGQIVTALRKIGFDRVYDTCFGADLTVIEEGNELLMRLEKGNRLPMFTSCCPAWVKFAEQFFSEMLPNLSTCRSPQQMFGSLCKTELIKTLNISRENLIVVSIMPCTAKKYEANREEFRVDGNKDVDYVLTTQELCLMIKERGISFDQLQTDSFDMPYGFKTGAAVIFGTSGGVSEAVLRYAADKINSPVKPEYQLLRNDSGLKIIEVTLGEIKLRMAVVSGLGNARTILNKIRRGEEHFDLVEVMACPGGCINGGGQPFSNQRAVVQMRAKGLYEADKILQLHSAQENPFLQKIYNDVLTEDAAHLLLHTHYKNRKRISGEDFVLSRPAGEIILRINVCFGTSCFLRGAQELYTDLANYVRNKGIEDNIEFKISFCGEQCKKGPVVIINDKAIDHCTLEKATQEIERCLV